MHKILLVFGMLLGLGCSLKAQETIPVDVEPLLKKHLCAACHKVEGKLVGPGYRELAEKSTGVKELSALIVQPNPANWPGYPPMAAMPHLPKEDVKKIAEWIFSLKDK